MKDLMFTEELGVLFHQNQMIPYIVGVIEVDGKEYIGTIKNVRLQKGIPEIMAGEFFPYLDLNYFEAFEIYPDKFIVKRFIDIKAPNSHAADTITKSSHWLDEVSKQDIGSIRRNIPRLLNMLKDAAIEFNLSHPEGDLERAIFLINESLENFSNFTTLNKDRVDAKNLAETIADIKHNISQAALALLFW